MIAARMLAWLMLATPPLVLLGCSSAESGHAPGVAGGQTLTPGITNYPLAYIKRPVPTADIDLRDLITSITGSDLYVRAQASAGGKEVNVTKSLTKGMGAVRDLDVSPDGTKIVFSLRLPLDPNRANTDPKQPNWHIYQYDASTAAVTQLTNDDVTSGHDVGAHYLPDGRIVFASTRQLATQGILLDENRPQYQAVTGSPNVAPQAIFLLHVMNADGSGMHQISFNTDHDFAPSVLANGQIVFSRWEFTNGVDAINLYRANPDGTGLELYYGANSHATGANAAGTDDTVVQFLNARERADGKTLLALVRPFGNTQLGGDTVAIDAADFVEIHQPSTQTVAGGTPPTGPGQASATTLGVTTDPSLPSLGGRFASFYPLYDGTNRMLVSWAPCLLQVGNATVVCNDANTSGTNVHQAPAPYTIWVYDFGAGTLSPVLAAETALQIVEPVILEARSPVPTIIPDAVPPTAAPPTPAAQALADAGVGLLDIKSVYDFDGIPPSNPTLAQLDDPQMAEYYSRAARFIRIQKAVEIPAATVRNFDQSAFGPLGRGAGMREILGYAPIAPDGSVQIQVPANVPFTIDILDVNGRRLSATASHSSWLQLLPGETKTCNGCHNAANGTSHGRSGLTAAINQGAAASNVPFKDINAAISPIQGETMAETLARISCQSGSPLAPCSQILSTDVTYTPVWTTGEALPAGSQDTAVAYDYSGMTGLSEVPPTNASCLPWTAQCRITIHYANAMTPTPVYLQNIWDLTPRTATVNNVANTSVVCVTCHTTAGTVAGTFQLPAGNLALTGELPMNANYVTSYQYLLFAQNKQFVNTMGQLQDVVGPNGPMSLPPPMSAGSAARSATFLRIFDGTYHDPVLDHTGFLTLAELRLISEWLDIGAQYYNDPFVAPLAQ